MEKFKFVMNEYKNTCYVFMGLEQDPVDTLSLVETEDDENGGVKRGWMPQSYSVQNLLCKLTEDLDAVKEFYNENYEEICENLFSKGLFEFPEVINGFCLDQDSNRIIKVGGLTKYDRFGIVKTHKQAKGIQAFCELSQILSIFNEGWEPDWNDLNHKWSIRTTDSGIKILHHFTTPVFLSFETKEKAELFLKGKINLITDLSNARII